MLRDIFTNKWILCGLGFLIIFTGLCYLWYQHDTAPYRKQAAELDEMIHQFEKQRTASTGKSTERASDLASAESSTQIAEEQPIAKILDTNEITKKETPLTHVASTETDKPVSPHGFGPFPEVPTGYSQTIGIPSWIRTKLFGAPPVEAEFELMERVKIKLWQQGHTNVRGSFMKNGKVIITYSNKVYAQYGTRETPDGKKVRTLLSWTSASVPAPQRDFANPDDTSDLQVPAGITIIEGDEQEHAIDPYEFLGLNNR